MSMSEGTGNVTPGAVHSAMAGKMVLPGQVQTQSTVQPDVRAADTVRKVIPSNEPPAVSRPPEPDNFSQAKADADAVDTSFISFSEDEDNQEGTQEESEVEGEGSPQELTPAAEEEELPDTPAAENFKKLRTSLTTERQTRKDLEVKLQSALKKVEKYEKGETIPDVVKAKDARIAQLEPYEKIVSLKFSPEYQEEIVKPSLERHAKLEKLGEDYGLPPEMMRQAVGIENRRERNAFLAAHFDDVGGLQVSRIIDELHDIADKAIELEKQPDEAMQTLRSQYEERQKEERSKRAGLFESVATNGWNAALLKTKKEGVCRELILHDTDSDFNSKVVEPNQQAAAVQYGALIKELSKNGLTKLPDRLAEGLARMVILSIGGMNSLRSRAEAEKKLNAVKEHSARTHSYMHPSMGGTNGAVHGTKAVQAPTPTTFKEAGREASKFFNK